MGNPHVLVIPFPAQGHVLPFMELSQWLVKHGIKVTFVNTEDNHKRVIDALPTKDGMGNQIHLVSVPLERESTEDKSEVQKIFESIFHFMPRKVEELIEQINAAESDKITCVIADHMLGWAMEVAVGKGIKGAVLCPASATRLALRPCIPKLIDDGILDNDGFPTKEQMFHLSPSMPVMSTSHLAWDRGGDKKMQKMVFDYLINDNRSLSLSDWVVCNSTYDLEPATFDAYPKIQPIGPLLASNRHGDSAGNFWPEDLTCLKWLDQQQPQSVIYVAFGSLATFDQTQFQELAMGLELSNRPFLWVVRPDLQGTNDAYLKEFRERVVNRGHIVSWAPQQKVLGHPSIACFISHCGWNSIMEAVSNGIPFLCWPYTADQFHNEYYICDIWKIGLGFSRDERGIIMREEIKSKLEQLLDNEEYKARALSLSEIVMNSIKEGGSSYKNFMNFIEWIKA